MNETKYTIPFFIVATAACLLLPPNRAVQSTATVRADCTASTKSADTSQTPGKTNRYGQIVYSTRLTTSGNRRVVFKLLRSGDSNDGAITAKFVCTDRCGRVGVFYKIVGDVLGSKYFVSVADYTGSGRKQVFVTAGVRATNACVLDCDGTKLRTLYERFCLYVPAMVHPSGKRWFVEEVARKDSIATHSGTYYETNDRWRYQPYSPSEEKANLNDRAADGLVTRLLGWNGRTFVTDETGKSRVIATSYRDYLQRHHMPIPRRYSRPALEEVVDNGYGSDEGEMVPMRLDLNRPESTENRSYVSQLKSN